MHPIRLKRILIFLFLMLSLSGCTGVAPGLVPVKGFELERYLGTWYEIARLDHSFERGLENVTAQYSVREGGGVRVINRGYSSKNDEWKTAEGKAFFVSGEDVGHLKVSFFGPFYGSYVIFELDKDGYEYAFVSSYKKSYLWLLSRKPVVDSRVMERFLQVVKSNGFQTDELIYVKQNQSKIQ